MAFLEAKIEWRVLNDNGEEVSSSYEDISDIEDAQTWVDHMVDLLEDSSDKED